MTNQPISLAALDLPEIAAVINAAAQAYRGVIPADCWHEPYMPADELAAEVTAGVAFSGLRDRDGTLAAVMGLQQVGEVALIRHAYTRPASQGQGLGSRLLAELLRRTDRPVLIGTWAAAHCAVRFYEARGFRRVTPAEKEVLLHRYWTVPARQVETSVVLADERWRARHEPGQRPGIWYPQGDSNP